MAAALGQLRAVPYELWWDNEAGIGRRGRLTDPITALMGTLGSRLVQLKPSDPESKGMVERANRYLETSFLPGGSFTSPMLNWSNGFRVPTVVGSES